jgi:lysophospholipase L1-like esterase
MLGFLSAARSHAQEPSFLQAGDNIVFIGDSITEIGHYGNMVNDALADAYPAGDIVAANQGSGGKTASAGMGLLKVYMAKQKPTIVCVMFGVNDTSWAASGADQKAAAFAKNLATFLPARDEHGFELIFLRTSDFSHDAKPDGWVDGLNKALGVLFEAQNEFAKSNNIPIIDVHGAYRSALARAWEADPLYAFTPDVVHPLLPGSAAMAAEILRAFGVGLPLAGKERGPLRIDRTGPFLKLTDKAGVVPLEADIPLHISSDQGNALPGPSGALGYFKKEESAILAMKPLTDRIAVYPLWMWGTVNQSEAFGSALLHVSPIHDLDKQPYKTKAGELKSWSGHAMGDSPPSTVSDIEVKHAESSLYISFAWSDASIVPAAPGFKSRFGQEIKTALNLQCRAGDQPCDAVEFCLDLRPDASTGRYTSGSDGVPEGIMKIGVYFEAGATATNAAIQVHPESESDKASLKQNEDGTYTVSVSVTPAGKSFGFNAIVTDKTAFAGGGQLYHFGGVDPQDPLGFIRLGLGVEGLFYRIGY